MKCNFDCLNCIYPDCICEDEDLTLEERMLSDSLDLEIKREERGFIIPELGMKKYIRNRLDKKEYEYLRNKKYEDKRKYSLARKEYQKAYYQKNRIKKLEYQKAYYQKYKDEILAKKTIKDITEYRKEYYQRNKEKILEKNSQYNKTNERYLEYQREYHKREESKLKRKEYYEKNKEQIRLKQKEYRERNREEINKKKREVYRSNVEGNKK